MESRPGITVAAGRLSSVSGLSATAAGRLWRQGDVGVRMGLGWAWEIEWGQVGVQDGGGGEVQALIFLQIPNLHGPIHCLHNDSSTNLADPRGGNTLRTEYDLESTKAVGGLWYTLASEEMWQMSSSKRVGSIRSVSSEISGFSANTTWWRKLDGGG